MNYKYYFQLTWFYFLCYFGYSLQKRESCILRQEILSKKKGKIQHGRYHPRHRNKYLFMPNSTICAYRYEDTITWNNEIGNATFCVTVPIGTLPGSKTSVATIHANQIQIARIYFSIKTGNNTTPTEIIQSKLHKNRSAFASYSSEDRDLVLAFSIVLLKKKKQEQLNYRAYSSKIRSPVSSILATCQS